MIKGWIPIESGGKKYNKLYCPLPQIIITDGNFWLSDRNRQDAASTKLILIHQLQTISEDIFLFHPNFYSQTDERQWPCDRCNKHWLVSHHYSGWSWTQWQGRPLVEAGEWRERSVLCCLSLLSKLNPVVLQGCIFSQPLPATNPPTSHLQNIEPWWLSVILLITFLMTVILQVIIGRKSWSETDNSPISHGGGLAIIELVITSQILIITNCDPRSVQFNVAIKMILMMNCYKLDISWSTTTVVALHDTPYAYPPYLVFLLSHEKGLKFWRELE